jgi:hypothetical protein
MGTDSTTVWSTATKRRTIEQGAAAIVKGWQLINDGEVRWKEKFK